MRTYIIQNKDGTERSIRLTGRDEWALRELMAACRKGCTPIDNPAPRWSAYVHDLRHKHGLDIETITESHGGPFAGHHARYVLHNVVREVLSDAT